MPPSLTATLPLSLSEPSRSELSRSAPTRSEPTKSVPTRSEPVPVLEPRSVLPRSVMTPPVMTPPVMTPSVMSSGAIPAAASSGALPRPDAPGASRDLLAGSARELLASTAAEDPETRYAHAHLAALRAAAAVLAARARPRGRRSSRVRSAWVLLAEVAPELSEWAAFFAAGASKRAAAEAGLRGVVTEREADDLLRDVETFLALVARVLGVTRQLALPDVPASRAS